MIPEDILLTKAEYTWLSTNVVPKRRVPIDFYTLHTIENRLYLRLPQLPMWRSMGRLVGVIAANNGYHNLNKNLLAVCGEGYEP